MAIISMRIGDLDLQGLEELCAEIIDKNHKVVEIGSYAGESSNILAEHAGKLYCIDPWTDGLMETGSAQQLHFHYQQMAKVEALFDAATTRRRNVIKIRGTSNDLADVFGECSVDFVYIDALHSYEAVHNDINRWWPKVKPAGHIGGHNYSPWWPAVVKAVREAFGSPDKLYCDTSWVVRKAAGRKLWKLEDDPVRQHPSSKPSGI